MSATTPERQAPVRLHGILIAPAARDWLTSPRGPAIHSLYRQAVNLVDEREELLSLVLQDTGPGPFSLVVRPETPDFRAGGGFEAHLTRASRVETSGAELSIGPLRVALSSAAHWKPRPSWEAIGKAQVRASLDHLRQLLGRHAPEGSFAPLAEPTASDSGPTFAAAALRAAAKPARDLMQAIRERDGAAAAEAAERLAGLGGGVTPSGDDYLLGAVQALWALAEPTEAQRLSEAIVATAVPRTNLISGAWLKAAGRGEAGNEWHVLAIALASGAPVDEPAEWLIRRGHTSGADALAGFLAVASLLLES